MPVSPAASAPTPAVAKPPKSAPAIGPAMLPALLPVVTLEPAVDPPVLAPALRLRPPPTILPSIPPPACKAVEGRMTLLTVFPVIVGEDQLPVVNPCLSVLSPPVLVMPVPVVVLPILPVVPPVTPTELNPPPKCPGLPAGSGGTLTAMYREQSPSGTQIVSPLCSTSA